jgi:uncharacterized membrane protein YfcA
MNTASWLLPILTGVPIGLVVGLVGGGGSILAVPLLVYVVGVASPHAAIGTAAIAVAANAGTGLLGHARAEAGKALDGERLLAAFGVLMLAIGALQLLPRRTAAQPNVRLSRETAAHLLPRLVPIGLGVGLLAGFFGIGGGFLIVPGLVLATAMPIGTAIGTSLVVVVTLGLATAASYAWSGLVDWRLSALLVLGGAVGALVGVQLARYLAGDKHKLEIAFGCTVIAVGAFIVLGNV